MENPTACYHLVSLKEKQFEEPLLFFFLPTQTQTDTDTTMSS